jgi:hypothetical protein
MVIHTLLAVPIIMAISTHLVMPIAIIPVSYGGPYINIKEPR